MDEPPLLCEALSVLEDTLWVMQEGKDMGEPASVWYQELAKDVKSMSEDIKLHREETKGTHTEFVVFRSEIGTLLSVLDPKELSTQLNNLSNDVGKFRARVDTLTSVTKWATGILAAFLLGCIVTWVDRADKLTLAVSSQAVELSHLGKQIEKLEKAQSQSVAVLPGGLEDSLKSVSAQLGAIGDVAKEVKKLSIRSSMNQTFVFVLTKRELMTGGDGLFRFQTHDSDPDKIERYEQIVGQFSDYQTRTSLRDLSPGLCEGIPKDTDCIKYFNEVLFINAKPLQGGRFEFTLEPRTKGKEASEKLLTFIRNLTQKDNETLTIVLKFYI